MRFMNIVSLLVIGCMVTCGLVIPSVDLISSDIVGIMNEFRQSYLPRNLDSAAAVAVADTVAGAIGAIGSRKTAVAIGNKKKDSLKTKITTTSAFFGTRGLIGVSGLLLGMPRPITVLCAAVLGTLVAELAKSSGRNADNLLRRIEAEKQTLDAPEIAGDVLKWLSYDLLFSALRPLLLQSFPVSSLSSSTAHDTAALIHLPPQQVLLLVENVGLGFGCGALAALLGVVGNVALSAAAYQRLRESLPEEFCALPLQNLGPGEARRGRAIPRSYQQAALEGGVLFGTFQLVLGVLLTAVPEGSQYRFAFYDWIGQLEEQIPEFLQRSSMMLNSLSIIHPVAINSF